MNNPRFNECFDFLMKWEGETFEDDPNDPGGATKFGLDQRSHPNLNIRNLTIDQAREIYHDNEWTKCRCDELPAPWDLVVFDSAVNPGIGWTVPALQTVAGTKADGYIGPKTIAAVQTLAGDGTKVESFLRARESYYKARPATRNGRPFRARYLAGWMNRVADLRLAALTDPALTGALA